MTTEDLLSAPDATLAVEIGAFLIVLAVVAKFVLPKLRATVEQRQARIADALAEAENAERRRRAADMAARSILSAARRQARAIRDDARATKEHLLAEGRREGQAEYKWRATQFGRERQRHDDLMRRRVTAETTKLVLDAIRRMSADEADRVRLTELVEQAITASAVLPDDSSTCRRGAVSQAR